MLLGTRREGDLRMMEGASPKCAVVSTRTLFNPYRPISQLENTPPWAVKDPSTFLNALPLFRDQELPRRRLLG